MRHRINVVLLRLLPVRPNVQHHHRRRPANRQRRMHPARRHVPAGHQRKLIPVLDHLPRVRMPRHQPARVELAAQPKVRRQPVRRHRDVEGTRPAVAVANLLDGHGPQPEQRLRKDAAQVVAGQGDAVPGVLALRGAGRAVAQRERKVVGQLGAEEDAEHGQHSGDKRPARGLRGDVPRDDGHALEVGLEPGDEAATGVGARDGGTIDGQGGAEENVKLLTQGAGQGRLVGIREPEVKDAGAREIGASDA